MRQPTVSFVIPMFNEEENIDRAIDAAVDALAKYTDDYGPRGSGFHYGIDMLAPTGTTLWAVKPGNVHYATEDAGGLAAYVFADGGNVYYYAHMSGIIGAGDRRVAQGDVIGLVGESGNATAPHLHFEIRLGSVTAHGIDPYPTLKNAGC